MLMLAAKIDDPFQAGAFNGVVYSMGVAPLYIGKAVEVFKTNKTAANVEIAKVKSEG